MGPRRARRRGMIMGAAIANSRNKAANASQAAPQASSSTSDDNLEQLKKLAELKDQGILTQEEFDAKKKQILGL